MTTFNSNHLHKEEERFIPLWSTILSVPNRSSNTAVDGHFSLANYHIINISYNRRVKVIPELFVPEDALMLLPLISGRDEAGMRDPRQQDEWCKPTGNRRSLDNWHRARQNESPSLDSGSGLCYALGLLRKHSAILVPTAHWCKVLMPLLIQPRLFPCISLPTDSSPFPSIRSICRKSL